MSVSYFMLKMLQRKRKQAKENKPTENNSVAVTNELNNLQCRICLKLGNKYIYGQNTDFNIAEAVQIIGGISISDVDSFPKHLCEDCYDLLKGAIKFRKLAQQSEKILKQVPIIEDDLDDDLSHISAVSIHDVEKPKVFKCKTCKNTFKSLDNYISHRNLKHRNIRIQCPLCRRLLTTTLYKKHLARHESTSNLICEVCGKLFRKDNLARHLQSHSFELPFKCQLCPYRGRFFESLKTHTHTHTGHKPFACDKCNLRFLTRSNLNRHLLTHKQIKAFKCIECNRGFHTKKDMDIHFIGDHVGIKDFCCRLCGKKYGTRKALMGHELRVHKRVKMAKGRLPLYLQPEFIKSNDMT